MDLDNVMKHPKQIYQYIVMEVTDEACTEAITHLWSL